MFHTPTTKVAKRLAAAAGVTALMFAGVGTAAAEEFEPPVNIQNNSTLPGCLVVAWQHSSSGVAYYTVSLDGQDPVTIPDAVQFTKEFCSLAAGSTHRVKVCAVFNTEDEDEACAPEKNLTAAADGNKVGELDNPQEKPTPPIVAVGSGTDWVDLEWGWKAQGPHAGFDTPSFMFGSTAPAAS
ncbi:hypothetical protein [Mycolicibacterium stellerae]|uniref:hypothetical protein n=1 Tax=Mycolicibacterium stellerae TaxID=2358193 RepID=UPI000F0B4708|nr:hypothetical protein [Mycolicibacterium stellerae]